MKDKAEVAVVGGTGLYSLLEKPEGVKVDTPFGSPSDMISLGVVGGRKIAFLPRHGRNHQYPPHRIPYKANIWALRELGVKRIIAPCVVGSLQPHIKLGDFVVCDQFVDRTKGKDDSFYNGPVTTHISTADPYCPELRKATIESGRALGLKIHSKGTVVVIQGPRFSSRAESLWFQRQGWDVINMTQYPEVTLARELEMCYVNISLVTDYDAWKHRPTSHKEILDVLSRNVENVRKLIEEAIPRIPFDRRCKCGEALKLTRF